MKEERITVTKSTLWQVISGVLVVLLVASISTGGFGIKGDSGNDGARVAVEADDAGGADLIKAINDNPSLFPIMGPSSAKITVTEFIDFQCPYCGIASGLVPWGEQYKSQYSDLYGSAGKVKNLAKEGKIRYAVGMMSFLGKESIYAAQAAYCANEQGKFFEMEDALYSAQTQGENSGKFNKDKLEIIAQKVNGLDQAEFKNCLENDKTLSSVQQSANIARQFASGTPTFYVNNKRVSSSWSALSAEIEA